MQQLQAEIDALEEQLVFHKKLLDQSIKNNVEFAKTKVIFHELRKISDKLNALKKTAEDSRSGSDQSHRE